MKLNYITIMVRDMEKSLAFYTELVGLQIVRQFNPGMGQIAFLANAQGETMLELIEFANVEKVSAKGLVVSFLAGDALEDVHQKAQTLGYQPTELVDHPPKPKHFTVTDPDGICVEFSA